MLINVTLAKTGHVFSFDTTTLPAPSTEYAMEYGLTQSINDSAASIVRKNYPAGDEGDAQFRADAQAKADARFAQVVSGNVPGRTRTVDPIRALAMKLGMTDAEATAILTAAAKKKAA